MTWRWVHGLICDLSFIHPPVGVGLQGTDTKLQLTRAPQGLRRTSNGANPGSYFACPRHPSARFTAGVGPCRL